MPPKSMTRQVAVLVYDGLTMLDVAGPADVFAHANLFGARYTITAVSPDGGDAWASNGLGLRAGRTVDELEAVDVAIVPGALGLLDRPFDPVLLTAVKALVARSARVASVCTGSFLLAEVGALDGRRATTHWNRVGQLRRRYPAVEVVEDALYVRDDPVITSAGVTSGVDLALSLVEQDYGPEIANRTVRQMIVFMQRPGDLPQHSVRSRVVAPADSPLRSVLDAVTADPGDDWTTSRLACLATVSTRTLTRLFRDQLSTSPSRYVEQVRVEAAKGLLLQGTTVARAAQLIGFGSTETMRRVFVNQVGVSPSVYARSPSS